MAVRTIRESLATTEKDGNYKSVVNNQRRRRVLRRRLDGVVKDVKDGMTGSVRGLPMSETSSSDVGSINSFASTISTEKFDVRFNTVSIREYKMIPGDNPRYVLFNADKPIFHETQ